MHPQIIISIFIVFQICEVNSLPCLSSLFPSFFGGKDCVEKVGEEEKEQVRSKRQEIITTEDNDGPFALTVSGQLIVMTKETLEDGTIVFTIKGQDTFVEKSDITSTEMPSSPNTVVEKSDITSTESPTESTTAAVDPPAQAKDDNDKPNKKKSKRERMYEWFKKHIG